MIRFTRDANRGIPKLESRDFFKLVLGFFRIYAALSFMLNEIRAINCSLAKDLYKSLRKRIEERRTVYSPLQNFLRNPN